jgi:hypothetical protein
MIKKYDIVRETNHWKVIEAVNKAIQTGWQPYGELWENNPYFYQVIVKTFDEDEKMLITMKVSDHLLKENTKEDLKDEDK